MSAIWRCPDCETLNSGDKCVVCGKLKPGLGNDKQESLKREFIEKQKNVYAQLNLKDQLQHNNIKKENIDQQIPMVAKDDQSLNAFKLVIIMLAVVTLLLAVAAFLLIKGRNNNNNDISNVEISASDQSEETSTSENEQAVFETERAFITSETVTATTEKETEQTTLTESASETSERSTSAPAVTTTVTTSQKAISKTTVVTSVSLEKGWTERAVNKAMYTTRSCYARSEPKADAKAVERYDKGAAVYAVAVTDTAYYKLNDGSYIYGDYLSENNPSDTYNETQSAANKQIRLSKTAFTLTKGYSVYLSALNCDTSDVKWSTSNSNIVTVSDKGKVIGVDSGTAFVYATANGQVCKCEVTVVAGKITSSRNSIYLSEGESVSVRIKTTGIHDIGLIEPEDPIVKIECDSSTSNKGYSTLKITGISDGDGVIRVYLSGYPEIFYDISVNVSYPILTN